MQFEFATVPRIVFGAGTINQTGAQVKHFGRRAVVVTGSDSQRAERLLANLSASGISTSVFAVQGEPEIATVQRGVELAKKEGHDLIVSIGGGSVIDAGKAIAAMLANDGNLLDYLEVVGQGRPLRNPSIPFVAIPTTAGTGAEVTRNAVLASPQHQLKVSLRSPLMLAHLALIDPELTYNLPPSLTASTGMDALTQLIEPYVCRRANPMTDGLCVEGIHRVARSLRVAVFEGGNHSAREDMAVASLFGGLALANAGLGAVHGFAGPIGGSFNAPHGAVCGALLPHVMAANLRALRQRESQGPALARYQKVAALLTGDPQAPADTGVEWVQRIVADLDIPRLGAYGIREEHVTDLVTKAVNASSMKANPIVLSPGELADTLRLAL